MTKESAYKIKRKVFDEYYDVFERLSEGFDGYDSAMSFGRVLGLMEAELTHELSKHIRSTAKDGKE